jgi:hypothetical protein
MSKDYDFSGVWHSTYTYPSTSRNGTFTGEHELQFFRAGNQLVVQSLPNDTGSYALLRLTVDGRVLTGTWHEYTSPEGYYKGATYYGAIQFVLSEDGDSMHGKWVGFGKRMDVKTGDWKLVRKTRK